MQKGGEKSPSFFLLLRRGGKGGGASSSTLSFPLSGTKCARSRGKRKKIFLRRGRGGGEDPIISRGDQMSPKKISLFKGEEGGASFTEGVEEEGEEQIEKKMEKKTVKIYYLLSKSLQNTPIEFVCAGGKRLNFCGRKKE